MCGICVHVYTELNRTVLSIYSGKIVSLNVCILAIIPDMIFVIMSTYFNSWFVVLLLLYVFSSVPVIVLMAVVLDH